MKIYGPSDRYFIEFQATLGILRNFRITCCKSKELERNKEETKREFIGNSDDLHFMLIRPIYRLIVRRLKAFT